MSKINLTTVRIFGEKYAMDTLLVMFFGPLMASGVIEAWRFCRTLVVSVPIIAIIVWRYWQETDLFNHIDVHSISQLIKKAA